MDLNFPKQVKEEIEGVEECIENVGFYECGVADELFEEISFICDLYKRSGYLTCIMKCDVGYGLNIYPPGLKKDFDESIESMRKLGVYIHPQ
jgi:hypothetical protein